MEFLIKLVIWGAALFTFLLLYRAVGDRLTEYCKRNKSERKREDCGIQVKLGFVLGGLLAAWSLTKVML